MRASVLLVQACCLWVAQGAMLVGKRRAMAAPCPARNIGLAREEGIKPEQISTFLKLRGGKIFRGWSEDTESSAEASSEEETVGENSDDGTANDEEDKEEEGEEEEKQGKDLYSSTKRRRQNVLIAAKWLRFGLIRITILLIIIKLMTATLGGTQTTKILTAVLFVLGQVLERSGSGLGGALSGKKTFGTRPVRRFNFELLNERYSKDNVVLVEGTASPTEQTKFLGLLGSKGEDKDEGKHAKAAAGNYPKKELVYVLKWQANDIDTHLPFLTEFVNFVVANKRANATSESSGAGAKSSSTVAPDEVVIKLTSPGGAVSDYGLAASQLQRLKEADVKLTVCVDTVAASGGYMMAVVASRLIAAPFAVLGSIGVIGGMLNLNNTLKRFGAQYYEVTAGKYKSSIGLLNEVTGDTIQKQQDLVDTIQDAFKDHVVRHRPALDVNKIGTGEIWLGVDALRLGMIDEIQTSDAYLASKIETSLVLMVTQFTHQGLDHSILRKALLGPLAKVRYVCSQLSSILTAAVKVIESQNGLLLASMAGEPQASTEESTLRGVR
ncbi:unnamed protein product [Chrysoparadoxa australica]